MGDKRIELTRHPRANNWKGGYPIASNGYVLAKVGKDHHLADVRGYAYEHRMVAENKLGRRLQVGEIAHHINGIKTDNRPENLEIVKSRKHHGVRHRQRDKGLRLPDQLNRTILCACGCSGELTEFDAQGRPRRYLPHHNVAHDVAGRWSPLSLPRSRPEIKFEELKIRKYDRAAIALVRRPSVARRAPCGNRALVPLRRHATVARR